MKKFIKRIMALLVAVSMCALIGCKTDPEGSSYKDGLINVVNNSSQTIYVCTAALNITLATNDEIFENRELTSSIVSIDSGKTHSFDYDFSKYKDSRESVPTIMISYNKQGWRWYCQGSYDLYHQTATVYVRDYAQDSKYPIISEIKFSSFSFEPASEIKKVPVTNSTNYPMWVQFVAWEDPSTWDYPIAMSNRVLVEAGKTINLSLPKGFDNYYKSITVLSHEYNLGTWRSGTWTDFIPSSIDISIKTDTSGNESYSFNFK